MKRLKIGILLVVSCVFITACGCTKEDFTITFDSNGGTTVRSQTVEKGGKVTEPSDPTREGYTFAGWFIDLEDDTEYDFDTEVTGDLTLEAKWAAKTTGTEEEDTCTLTCQEGYELINPDSKDCSCKKVEEEKPDNEQGSNTETPNTPTKPSTVSVTGVSLDKTSLTLNVSGTDKVTATVSPSNATNKKVTYTSSDTNVVTVDANGNLKAVGSGTATITVKTSDGSKTATLTVTVNDVYTYSTEALDMSDISYKVYIYKNGTKISSVQAVYTSAGKYIGRYESEYDAIIVDKTQLSVIGAIKVNGTLIPITKK